MPRVPVLRSSGSSSDNGRLAPQQRWLTRPPKQAIARVFMLLAAVSAATNALANPTSSYKLQIGDVLELAVAGSPDFRHRLPVAIDGKISIPLVGSISVVGRTLTDVQDELGRQIPTKALPQRTPEGRESIRVISKDEIALNIIEYRPVYLDGDVGRPGEFTFRPGMTVRQLVSSGGGTERLGGAANLAGRSDLVELQSLRIERAREEIRIWRINQQLADIGSGPPSELPPQLQSFTDFVAIARAQLNADRDEFAREKVSLETQQQTANSTISLLEEKRKKDEEMFDVDQGELRTLSEFQKRGFMPNNRAADARRAVLFSATQRLQTVIQGGDAEFRKEQLRRQLEKITQERRTNLLKELGESRFQLAKINLKLAAAGDRSGLGSARKTAGSGADKPGLTIIRGDAQIPCVLETELMPGDVVLIHLGND
jgi:polysaccharide export outer membrane protein